MSKKEQIIEKLKENGCRITKQRLVLIDIILENDCASCKEIFYKASKADDKIGVATVYRMVNALEEIITLDDNTICHLSPGTWNKVVREGMRRCGYLKNQKIAKIKVEK